LALIWYLLKICFTHRQACKSQLIVPLTQYPNCVGLEETRIKLKWVGLHKARSHTKKTFSINPNPIWSMTDNFHCGSWGLNSICFAFSTPNGTVAMMNLSISSWYFN
jgi:hypothetical protein